MVLFIDSYCYSSEEQFRRFHETTELIADARKGTLPPRPEGPERLRERYLAIQAVSSYHIPISLYSQRLIMASIDIPTAVLAVLVSVTLSPFVNLISDGLKGWGKRYLEERDQLENWNNSTVELAKDAKIVWQTQYEEQDTSVFKDHQTWARKVRNSISQTKTRLRTHAQSAPPNAEKITEQKLIELIAACEALNEANSGSSHEDEFRETGQRVKEKAEELIEVTPHG